MSFSKPNIIEIQQNILKELKIDSWEKLIKEPYKDIKIDPIYTEAKVSISNIRNNDILFNFQEFVINTNNISEVNQKILFSLSNGCNGIILRFEEESIDFTLLLNAVQLEFIHTILLTDNENIISRFESYIHAANPSLKFCNWSSLSNKNQQVIEISSNDFMNQSASLLKSIYSLELKYLVIIIEMSGDYFFDISKIRALKNLTQNLMNKMSCESSVLFIGKTGLIDGSTNPMRDNVLRATTDAMASISGGCDGLWTIPYDKELESNTDSSSRLARNIFNILIEESFLDKTPDIAHGSYYIENYTLSIAKAIYNLTK